MSIFLVCKPPLMIATSERCLTFSDEELLARAPQDMAYFQCLYDRYEARLLRYIHRLVWVAGEEAADILQDAFLKIWTNLHAYHPALKPSSWIYRIVHNEAISWLRKRRAYGRDQQTTWEASPEAQAMSECQPEGADQQQAIAGILALLHPNHREVLVLRFLEEMSYAEISDVLRLPEGTVATRINRAKAAFAQAAAKSNLSFTW